MLVLASWGLASADDWRNGGISKRVLLRHRYQHTMASHAVDRCQCHHWSRGLETRSCSLTTKEHGGCVATIAWREILDAARLTHEALRWAPRAQWAHIAPHQEARVFFLVGPSSRRRSYLVAEVLSNVVEPHLLCQLCGPPRLLRQCHRRAL